jgi:hypothetical protein
MRLALQFVPEQTKVHRDRMQYAFRLFCAIYGHQTVTDPNSADAILSYAKERAGGDRIVRLTNGYAPRPASQPAPPTQSYTAHDVSTILFYEPSLDGNPDWLAEVFEWVSCADEWSVKERDSVGRVPYSASYCGRHRLSPRIPYANIAMRSLQRLLLRFSTDPEAGPRCPLESATHIVVATHDVDFLPGSRFDSVLRLSKNALISLLLNNSAALAARQAASSMAVALGARDPLDQIGKLAQEEHCRAISASYYFLCDKRHRRDGNYRIDTKTSFAAIASLPEEMEVGVHGSYRSLEANDGLAREFRRLQDLGIETLGGRQHWLRFTLPMLISAVRSAGASYDTSLGWPYTPGFRAGASFPFPPYDFTREQAAPFLEIPLIAMDQAVVDRQGIHLEAVAGLLAASRRYGWGGVSLLWHPTAFGGGQFPSGVGDAYWTLLERGLQEHDSWMSAGEFVRQIWPMFAAVGLLPQGTGNESTG